MVDLLRRIEGFLERAVEGSSRALFRQRVQPIELAKAAARAMQRQQLVGPEGIEVPNVFVVALHPDDAAPHLPYRASLEARIARYLATFADEHGFVPVGDISVAVLEDPGTRRWSVRIDARMEDAQVGPSTRPVQPIEKTAHLPRVERAAAERQLSPQQPTLLVLEDGRRLLAASGPIRFGRALDNDVVIADSRVSRYHARLEHAPHGFVVRDLGSTNGTAVDGQRISEGPVMIGDILSLGGYRVEICAAESDASAASAGWR